MKYILIILVFLPLLSSAQYTHIPLHSDLHDYARKLEIQGKSDLHAAIGEYSSRSVFRETIDTFVSLSGSQKYLATKLIKTYPEFWDDISTSEVFQAEYIDSTQTFYTSKEYQYSEILNIIEPEKPILKYFYANRNHLALIKAKGFLLKINPVLYFGAGQDLAQQKLTFENRRGIALSGHINDKVYFYSDILESQAVFPTYVNNYVNKFKAIPGNGFYKNYNSGVVESLRGYDFLNATAYINVNISKNIGVEFGNNNQFLGNGQRSLLLSDFTNNYLYLKLNTKIWKLHYQNIFAELIPISPKDVPSGQIISRKYMTTHYLSFKHKNIELGVFETVVFGRDDGFDLQYLNPVILYRLVEYNLASSDNVLIGLNGKWNIGRKFQLYGQVIMDEFKLNEFTTNDPDRQGWWANKYGIQAGVRYVDAFNIEGLDLQTEYNRVRPYTYGHRFIQNNILANYSHANQALAHPLGANFSEVNFSASYYITPKLKLSSSNYFMLQGLDTPEILFGANILRSSDEKPAEFGNTLLQGQSSRTILSMNKLSYEVFPNYFFDAKLNFRSQRSEVSELNFNNLTLEGAIRVNFWEPKMFF
ncbi:hypothetical protein [Portibacter marinus]|uniref:hypothetical protein n=1 Tax=Portibacter marinus TaxID=2898660 RepID=UPI001F23F2CB|nr:hypothetical protein [Portibacter marinus]